MPSARDILFSLPARFRPEKAGDMASVVHFDMEGEGAFTVHIAEGRCEVEEGFVGKASLSVRARAVHYIALETGELNPQVAIFSQKVRVSDLAAMMAFGKCFRKYRPEYQVDTAPVPDRKPGAGPLQGVRILDLTRLLPGPLATQMLADMGAEVIKIEHPDSPDYIRDSAPVQGGVSAYYLAINRSKRSLTLRYGTEEGNNSFFELVKSADLVVEQFRPGVMDEIGIGFEAARKHNPKICYVSLTGYGQTGPYAAKAGHDINYLAYAGILDQNRDAQGRPVIPGVQVADVAAGSYLCVTACLSALWAAQREGRGTHADVNMMEGLLPLLSFHAAGMWAGEKPLPNREGLLSGGMVNYDVYQTSDGKWMALGALEPKFWEAFCLAVGKPEWNMAIVPEIAAEKGIKSQIEALFASRTQAEWTNLGDMHDICLSPVRELSELPEDPHIRARGAIVSMQHRQAGELRGFRPPVQFSGYAQGPWWAAPELGEDEGLLA